MQRSEKINCQRILRLRACTDLNHTNASSHKDTPIVNACSSMDHPTIYPCLRNKCTIISVGKRRKKGEGTG